ncbi:MAG: BtpA/SgcQ family protein [Planctomycetota bacterium]
MQKPLVGVVHLPPLASAPGHRSFDAVLTHARRDAAALAAGGVTGLCVENFGDAPFHKGTADDPVPPDVPAALAVVARELRLEHGLPVMVNCLRNDGVAALGAAAVCGARWVRVNVLCGAYATDQGVIEGEAARIAAYRKRLGVDTAILADLLVKHAAPLVPLDPAVAARDLRERSGAAGLILTGDRTGEPVDAALLDTVRAAVGAFPIWLGSGLSAANAAALWPRCDGAIVGTSLKRGGRVHAPVDARRVRALVAALRAAERPAGAARRRR